MAMQFIIAATTLLVASTAAQTFAPQCPADSPVSCSVSNPSNTCCTEVNGQVLQVQLWDSNPATGPADSWTIHGLWPDECNGGYTENCDSSRDTYNISCILEQYGDTNLLNYMNEYWINDNGNQEEFWEHEWNTHGTCFSTLNPSCVSNYQPQEEIPAFFSQVVSLFQNLTTYTYLENAGITPSSSQTYTSQEILNALYQANNVQATISCQDGALYQVEYYFNVQGSVADGTFIPVNPTGSSSNCPSTGIQYLPKQLDTTPQTSPTSCPGGSGASTS